MIDCNGNNYFKLWIKKKKILNKYQFNENNIQELSDFGKNYKHYEQRYIHL